MGLRSYFDLATFLDTLEATLAALAEMVAL